MAPLSSEHPPARRRLLLHSLTSLLDQAWLSGLNLLLGLALIRLTTKDAYGTYAQLYVVALFVVSMVEASIINPLNTVVPGKAADERARIIACLAHFQRRVTTGMALFFGVVTLGAALVLDLPQPLLLAAAFGIYLHLNTLREFRRGLHFLDGQPTAVLRMDVTYGVALIAGVATPALLTTLTLPMALAALALASAASLLYPAGPVLPAPPPKAEYRSLLAVIWKRGRLGWPGAMSSWVVNYGYLFLTAYWLGAAATADLNASRLLLMPILLSVVAWSRVALPAVSRMQAAYNHRGITRLALASIGGLLALAAAYVAVLWLALPWLQTHLLGHEYSAVGWLVPWWAAYFAVFAIRTVGTVVMLGADGYRPLLVAAFAGLVATLCVIVFAIPRFGQAGAIGTLILVEVLTALLIWAVLIPKTRHRH
ncbi:putative integral membrane protein [plant metagenome]|uniref:Putative integral membrane protein n=1 Tax=plant metagenome TaxID=1297885 RepID=A0A484U5R2_9ZZZZ